MEKFNSNSGRHILINFLCENIELIKHLSISDPVLQDAYAQLGIN